MDDGAGPGTIEVWETRYQAGEMAWELGQAAPSLMQWFHAQPEASGHVTVLGCGRAHDAIALAVAGFDVTAIDFAPTALAAVRALKPVALAHQWPLGDEQIGVYQRL